MKTKLLLLLMIFALNGFSQKKSDSRIHHGITLQTAKENFDEYFNEPGFGLGIGYFYEFKLNRSNFVTAGVRFNYTSTNDIFQFRFTEQINDPVYNFTILMSENDFQYQFFSIDPFVKYQFFPFKKLPFMFTLGVQPKFIISENSKRNIISTTFKTVDQVFDSSDEVLDITEFDRENDLSNNLFNYSIGILGYKNDRFKIENVFEFGDWVTEGNFIRDYERVAMVINFCYYLNSRK